MPIEIKELVIKATIVDKNKEKAEPPPQSKEAKEEIIADCVEQVMEILRKQEER